MLGHKAWPSECWSKLRFLVTVGEWDPRTKDETMALKEIAAQPHGAPVATASASAVNVYAYRHFIGGAMGGMTAAAITSPLEVVKTRLQIKGGQYVATQLLCYAVALA